MDEKYEYYAWQDFAEDVEILAKRIKDSGQKFKNVYGVPSGGLALAICLHYRLNIPLLLKEEEITADTLIVDDISDRGNTLAPYRGHNFIATIYIHRRTATFPDIYLKERKGKYIHFPWEDEAPDISRWD